MADICSRGRARLAMCLMLGLAAAGASGCAAVGPDYSPPAPVLPSSWHTELPQGLFPDPVDARQVARWWERFQDPLLTELVEASLRGSPDIREAAARVQEARARRGLTRAELFPALDVSGDGAFSGELDNDPEGSSSGSGGTTKRFSAGFDAGWELDIFGGARRSVEAADADLEASRASLRGVWVTLAAETAAAYIEARTWQSRLAVARANLEAQEETFNLTWARREAGLEDHLAVQQARYNLESTRSRIPALKARLEAVLNGLAVLQGRAPGFLHSALEAPGSVPIPPEGTAVGIPADVLRRRPDIHRAERELAAQTARIGGAVADLYPRLRLRGSIGVETLDLNHLGAAAVWPFSYGLGLQWPVFDAGRIRRNIEVQEALQEQALAGYERTVLSALEEVENALSDYASEQTRLEALHLAAEAAEKAAELARLRYEAGLIDFGSVLDAQRSLLSFQDQVAESQGAVATGLVRLYKALGGGWEAMAWTGVREERLSFAEGVDK